MFINSQIRFFLYLYYIDTVLASEDLMWHSFQAHFCRFETEM